MPSERDSRYEQESRETKNNAWKKLVPGFSEDDDDKESNSFLNNPFFRTERTIEVHQKKEISESWPYETWREETPSLSDTVAFFTGEMCDF